MAKEVIKFIVMDLHFECAQKIIFREFFFILDVLLSIDQNE